MISMQEAVEIATREMGRESHELSFKEFDLGYLVWITPPPRDATSPPSSVGGSYLIVDKVSGETSAWPMLGASMTIDQYRRTRRGEQTNWEYDGRE